MKLSALTSSLPLALPAAVETISDLGLEWIDIPPTGDADVRRALRARGLQVACVALEREQPEGIDLACDDIEIRNRSLAYFRNAIALTAELDASVAYLTPPETNEKAAFGRWSESLISLADHAESYGIKLCIEHFPKRALPTVAATLEFLEQNQHDALALLIDVGHCLISGEDAAKAVVEAGERLGYLHFDDNDGVDDFHWPLLDGCLTEAQITAVIDAQHSTSYDGALCIELNPTLEQPLENLRRSRDLLHRCATRP